MSVDHERPAIYWVDRKQVPDSLEEIEAVIDPGNEDGESDDKGSDVSSDKEDDHGNINVID